MFLISLSSSFLTLTVTEYISDNSIGGLCSNVSLALGSRCSTLIISEVCRCGKGCGLSYSVDGLCLILFQCQSLDKWFCPLAPPFQTNLNCPMYASIDRT